MDYIMLAGIVVTSLWDRTSPQTGSILLNGDAKNLLVLLLYMVWHHRRVLRRENVVGSMSLVMLTKLLPTVYTGLYSPCTSHFSVPKLCCGPEMNFCEELFLSQTLEVLTV